jgi:hypothetical protein
MNFQFIRIGKKYYRTSTKGFRDKRTAKLRIQVDTLYVLELDQEKSTVFASVNKMPPEWFTWRNYRNWLEEEPETEKLKA